MTAAEAHQLYARLRSTIAARFPVVAVVQLKLHTRHFMRRITPRDFAWYDPADNTINASMRLLRQPQGRIAGVLAHELGHAADAHLGRPGAERRADRLAATALGQPILYDKGLVQNLDVGVTPRPRKLPT